MLRPQSFTTRSSGRALVLTNKVRVTAAYAAGTDGGMESAPEFDAIWDTGATNSLITQNVIDQVGLVATGVTMVQTAQGVGRAETYLAAIGLPNKVAIPQIRVSKGALGDDADVLIGMDIIGAGDFAVTTEEGRTMFSFRMPSMESIDFVNPPPTQPAMRSSRKVGRNDKCPCGSGKKYKRCHGR